MHDSERVLELRHVDISTFLNRSFLASLLNIRLLVRTEHFLFEFGNILASVSEMHEAPKFEPQLGGRPVVNIALKCPRKVLYFL
jgi:hypothetical protein